MTVVSLPIPERTPVWVSVCPRPLFSILEPPQPLIFPNLPSPSRKPAFDAPYVLTTHLIPSAHPHTYPDIPFPQILPANHDDATTKMKRKELAAKNCTILLEEEDLQWKKNASSGSQRPGQLEERSKKFLWNCVTRYAKRDLRPQVGIDADSEKRQPRLTLFLAHANGFPKEIWEPMLQHLLGSSSRSAAQIDEVWSWESVQHGDAGLLNSDNLGSLFDWSDNTRDILNFLLNYLPTTASSSSALPTHLPRLPHHESNRRKLDGFKQRTLVAIGHSYGGCTSALAAINCPALFSSLLLVDPIIVQPPNLHNSNFIGNYVLGALQRRDTWASREEALHLFRQTPFFAAWDPAVLKIYVECGLTANGGGGGVRLKMPGIHEAIVFAGRRTAYEVWERMEQLDERIALRWIMPGKHGVGIHGIEQMQTRVWLRPKNSSNVLLPAGHLIPQEAPQELARDIDGFLEQKYGTVRANL